MGRNVVDDNIFIMHVLRIVNKISNAYIYQTVLRIFLLTLGNAISYGQQLIQKSVQSE